MQETPSYLAKIRNLILRCKSVGQEFSTPLVNIIAVQYLDPGRYQKVLDDYEVVSLDWSSNDLDAIETELALIYQRRELTKTPTATASAAISSVSDRRWQTSTPRTRGIQDPSFYLPNKLFREHIKILYEEKKYFVCGNRHPTDADNGSYVITRYFQA